MYGARIRSLATVFVDAGSLVYSSRASSDLASQFAKDNFFPIPVQERLTSGVVTRMGFMRNDNEWQLLLLGSQFQFTQMPTDIEGSNFVGFEDFCLKAADVLAIALNYFERRGHRLAAVQEGFLSEVSVEKMNDMAHRLLQMPPTYTSATPFEWDWRCASYVNRKFGQREEPTNTLVTVKRQKVQYEKIDVSPPIEMDRIRIDIDINTLPAEVQARFGGEELRAFFENAPSWHKDMENEMHKFLNGDNK